MRHRFLFTLGAVLALATTTPSLHAQNLLQNPGFDQNLAGWQAGNYSPHWNAADASTSPHSGSARSMVPGGESQGGGVLAQCVAVGGGATYDFSLKARVQEVGLLVGLVYFYANTTCQGESLDADSVYVFNGQPNAWLTVHRLFTAPAAAQSARVELGATTRSGGAAHTLSHDDVYFGAPAPMSCVPDATTLCIDQDPGDARFRVRASFATVQSGGLSGQGNAIGLDSLGVDRGGLFWFFSADNPEALVKVLDACANNHYFWVFISAGTNVGVNVLVGDTQTGAVVLFHNPDLGAFPAIQNIYALPCG